MELKLLDRFVIVSIMPQQGSYADLILAQDIVRKTQVSSEEYEDYNIKVSGENQTVNIPNEYLELVTKIEYSDTEINFIGKQLKNLDDAGKLTVQLLEVYRKFVK